MALAGELKPSWSFLVANTVLISERQERRAPRREGAGDATSLTEVARSTWLALLLPVPAKNAPVQADQLGAACCFVAHVRVGAYLVTLGPEDNHLLHNQLFFDPPKNFCRFIYFF